MNQLIFCCAESSLLHGLFSSWGEWGLPYDCGVQTSHCGGFSCWVARALGCMGFSNCGPGLQGAGSTLWCTGLIVPWYVGSSRTRDGTHVSCIGRRILYHRAIREAQVYFHMFKDHLQFFCAQLCPTPHNPMDCSMSGSSIHGIFCEPSFHSLSNKIYFYKKLF